MNNMERLRLEDYNIAIQNFYDSIRGLNAATEEARTRCEKAVVAYRAARRSYDGEKAEHMFPSPSLPHCPEREAIEEQYRSAVLAYANAVNSIRLPPRIVYGRGREAIEQARNVSNSVFNALVDHERKHRCARARTQGRANTGSV
jgi:hypothetical protein